MSDLQDILGDLEDVFSAINGPNGVNGATGAITGPNREVVAYGLADASTIIGEIRAGIPPTLDPPDIGTVIPGYDPRLTFEFARDCLKLSAEAKLESGVPSPSQQRLGDLLATIESLLPGFRLIAGV